MKYFCPHTKQPIKVFYQAVPPLGLFEVVATYQDYSKSYVTTSDCRASPNLALYCSCNIECPEPCFQPDQFVIEDCMVRLTSEAIMEAML